MHVERAVCFARITFIFFPFILSLPRNSRNNFFLPLFLSLFLFLSLSLSKKSFLNFETVYPFSSFSFPPQTFENNQELNLEAISVYALYRDTLLRGFISVHVSFEEVVLPDYPHNFLVEMA